MKPLPVQKCRFQPPKGVILLSLMLLVFTAAFAPREGAAATGVNNTGAQPRFSFSGGPDGGTFQYFANGITSRLNQLAVMTRYTTRPSAGSVENLRRVNHGESAFGIVYGGDLYLGWKGLLNGDPTRYRTARSLAFLYSAPAQLIVRADSTITRLPDLKGKRVAIGGIGSGAAASARRFFTALGLWERIEPHYIGYNQAARKLHAGEIDAFWVLAGYPNEAVTLAAAAQPIRILDLGQAEQQSEFFNDYPFYSRTVIPPGTYQGVEKETRTFADSAFWVAHPGVRPKTVKNALAIIFSAEGLGYMTRVKTTAKAMSPRQAISEPVIPFHRGATEFWQGQNLRPPPPLVEQQPNPAEPPSDSSKSLE